MNRILSKEKKYIAEERDRILLDLFSHDYSDADIARIVFNVHRSNITMARKRLNVKRSVEI